MTTRTLRYPLCAVLLLILGIAAHPPLAAQRAQKIVRSEVHRSPDGSLSARVISLKQLLYGDPPSRIEFRRADVRLLAQAPVLGQQEICVARRKGEEARTVTPEIRAVTVTLLPPTHYKKGTYEPIVVQAVSGLRSGSPARRKGAAVGAADEPAGCHVRASERGTALLCLTLADRALPLGSQEWLPDRASATGKRVALRGCKSISSRTL